MLSRNKVDVPEGVAGGNFGSLMVEQLSYTQKVTGSSPVQTSCIERVSYIIFKNTKNC